MKNSKNKRTSIMIIILLGLAVIAYKVMFVAPEDNSYEYDENIRASERVEIILAEVQNINFDMEVTKDAKFQSLKSIEIPLMNLPIGKKNPFSGI